MPTATTVLNRRGVSDSKSKRVITQEYDNCSRWLASFGGHGCARQACAQIDMVASASTDRCLCVAHPHRQTHDNVDTELRTPAPQLAPNSRQSDRGTRGLGRSQAVTRRQPRL